MRRFLLTILLTLSILSVKAQIQSDSLSTDKLNEFIINLTEFISENSEDENENSELIDNYLNLLENPININTDNISYLLDLQIMTVFQHEQLKEYRRNFGDILFSDELHMIEGFDEKTIEIITPIVLFGAPDRTEKIKFSHLINRSENKLVVRTEQVVEQQAGYASLTDDEWMASPNSHYVGSPQKIFTRYSYNFHNKIRAGITLEKDAGEAFFMSNIPDTLRTLLNGRNRSGFDFNSMFVYASDIGIIKDFIVGDYQLSIGQGLTMSSGLAFGKSSGIGSLMKMNKTIKPSTGASEANHLRGTAVTLNIKDVSATMFFSHRSIDATVSETDSLGIPMSVSTIRATGLHRTINELNGKHVIDRTLFGTHLSYDKGRFHAGYTIHHTHLNAELKPTDNKYNQFAFRGTDLTNQGVDVRYFIRKIVLFGEASMSDNGGKAMLCGAMIQPASYITMSMLYRNYSIDYQNMYCTAFSEASGAGNEEGLYFGIDASIAPNWQMIAYADFFRFPWLRSSSYAPSFGHDYLMQINHNISRKASFYIRIRSKDKLTNSSQEGVYQPFLIHYVKNSLRLQIDYHASDDLSFKSRAEVVTYKNDDGECGSGFLMLQDAKYKPQGKAYSLSARYCIFNVNDYRCRIYTYEDDVLYAFTVPGFSNKGTRIYMLANYKINKKISIYGRIGMTKYSNMEQIGSGTELIDGTHRTDVKVQIILSL